MKSAARTFNGSAIVMMIMSSLSARSQKTRKTTAKMEGLYLSKKSRGGRKAMRKALEQLKKIMKVAVQRSDN